MSICTVMGLIQEVVIPICENLIVRKIKALMEIIPVVLLFLRRDLQMKNTEMSCLVLSSLHMLLFFFCIFNSITAVPKSQLSQDHPRVLSKLQYLDIIIQRYDSVGVEYTLEMYFYNNSES